MSIGAPVENQGASQAAVSHHYDVGNAFYRLWLGPTMTYSCAMWAEGDGLDSAQIRKLDYHARQSGAPGAGRVLDIGCGWGSLLERLKEHHGVSDVVGLTLSQSQYDSIRAKDMPGVRVLLEDWQHHEPEAPYDAAVSIGAFEHFARRDLTAEERGGAYRAFFERCREWLSPGGRLSLQTIACGNMIDADFNSFLSNDIFPESTLPRLSEIVSAADRLFEVETVRNDRMDYAVTCRHWLKNLQENREEAVKLKGEETVTNYEKYLRLCVIGFEALASIVLYRLTLRRIDRPRMG